MGIGLAIDFARAGLPVCLESRDEGRASRACEAEIAELVSLGVLDALTGAEVRRSIEIVESGTSRKALSLVIECVPEDEQIKLEVLRSLKDRHPGAVLATNTSSLSVTALADLADVPDQLVGIHFLNPPYMFRIVEFIPGRASAGARDRALSVLQRAGKEPVLCKRDLPGFLWNRLQFALLREAFELIESGAATVADVDRVVAEGLAPRWTTAGPLATVVLGGPETFVKAAEAVLPSLGKRDSLAGIEGAVGELGREASSRSAASERVRLLSRLGALVPGIATRTGTGALDGDRNTFSEVDHVGVAVRSIDRSLSWYREHLGLRLVHVEELPDIAVRLAYIDAGNVSLQLVEPTGPGKVAAFLEKWGEGLHHICWAVDGIDAALRQAQVDEAATVFLGGRGHPACFLEEEPNGVRIELIERRTVEGKTL